jgi:Zn-dependent protease/predicted transcriptional regulator
MSNGFRLVRIAGIDVYLDWSLILIFTLISFSLAGGLFPAWHPDWTPGLRWTTALVAAVAFILAVLLHELSHAFVARMFDMRVPRITLFVFGGMAHMQDEPKSWKAELAIAIIGPIVSLAIGLGCLWLGSVLAAPLPDEKGQMEAFLKQLGPAATLLFWLGPVNVTLAVFNLIPGFPLDGGRVLRALLWGSSGNYLRATRWASRLGQAFAALLIAAGFAMVLGVQIPYLGRGVVNGLWLALIGWFLNNAALMSYRQLVIRESLNDVPVERLMQRAFRTVQAHTAIRDLAEDFLNTSQRAFPVLSEGRFAGLVCLEDLRKVPREQWVQRTAADIMTPEQALASLKPGDNAADALMLLARRNVNQLPVCEHRQLIGLIQREDIMRWLMLFGEEPRARHSVAHPRTSAT